MYISIAVPARPNWTLPTARNNICTSLHSAGKDRTHFNFCLFVAETGLWG